MSDPDTYRRELLSSLKNAEIAARQLAALGVWTTVTLKGVADPSDKMPNIPTFEVRFFVDMPETKPTH